MTAGLLLFTLAKLIKFWAVRTLGPRWSFRILVLPGAPLVTGGPYRYMTHPNYVGVFGEFAGSAVMLNAPVAGSSWSRCASSTSCASASPSRSARLGSGEPPGPAEARPPPRVE